jgi:hypothetical protein
MAAGVTYVVRTNLPPEAVTQIAIAIFIKWVDFALGHSSLGGKRLVYPTGRYAASISFKQENAWTVAIVADEGIAPHASVIEQGHGPIDLKTRLQRGRAYPMHRMVGKTPGTSLRRIGSGPPSLRSQMWAELRANEASGFASIGPNSSPDSWIIPPMPAYSPALILAAQAKQMATR